MEGFKTERTIARQVGMKDVYYRASQEEMEEVLVAHGFRKATELKDAWVGRGDGLLGGIVPLQEDLSERIWVDDRGECLEIDNNHFWILALPFIKDTKELSLMLTLEGINFLENIPDLIIGKEARKFLHLKIAEKGKELEPERKKRRKEIKKDILLQIFEDKTREVMKNKNLLTDTDDENKLAIPLKITMGF